MQTAIQFFNEMSWLANLLGITGFFGTCAAIFFKFVKPRISAASLEKLIPPDFTSKWTENSVKALARIAIVDDQPADFPTSELKADGYNIQTYRQVSLSTTTQLSTYDVVFLDMKGIVKDDPETGGMKLLAELRRLNPHQKICAVSSKAFDINATEFFRQADDTKKKPLTAQECRTVINTFLNELFSLPAMLPAAKRAAAAMPRRRRVELVSHLKRYRDGIASLEQLAQCIAKVAPSKLDAQALTNFGRAIAYASK
jgi:CheY-like chemotaxis protein